MVKNRDSVELSDEVLVLDDEGSGCAWVLSFECWL